MRTHTRAEAGAVVDMVEEWQSTFVAALGRPLVFASDEYYLLCDRAMPPLESYGEIAQQENGVGLWRAFQSRFLGRVGSGPATPGGFFQSVDGAPAAGYRAPRTAGQVVFRPRPTGAVTVLTGTYAAGLLEPLVQQVCPDAEVMAVPNKFFGGNIGVAGLMTGADLIAVLGTAPPDRRYLLPDVCLSGGRFLDGLGPEDLPRPVEVIPTDGAALRRALTASGPA
jgi:NifB/MoaA-like Fe-S oxidoreductase